MLGFHTAITVKNPNPVEPKEEFNGWLFISASDEVTNCIIISKTTTVINNFFF